MTTLLPLWGNISLFVAGMLWMMFNGFAAAYGFGKRSYNLQHYPWFPYTQEEKERLPILKKRDKRLKTLGWCGVANFIFGFLIMTSPMIIAGATGTLRP